MSTTNDFTGLLEPAVEIARVAGGKILEIYNSDFAVEEKDDRSPLTAADMASHHAIVDGLQALTPDIPVLSEESKSLPFDVRSGWQTYWLVDPLDGTKEFIKRNGEFTVNIALIHNGVPVLGGTEDLERVLTEIEPVEVVLSSLPDEIRLDTLRDVVGRSGARLTLSPYAKAFVPL